VFAGRRVDIEIVGQKPARAAEGGKRGEAKPAKP
jgi:hypothetical protein